MNMMNLLTRNLKAIEANGKIQEIRSVTGGDINEAFYVHTDQNEYFVKVNRKADKRFFQLEEQGLRTLAQTKTINVPNTYAVLEDEETGVPMLWMEWIKGKENNQTQFLLGERLAALHLCEGQNYGFEQSTYIGYLRQENGIYNSWLDYFRDKRLIGQLSLGRSLGRISGQREKRLFGLIQHLDEWIPSFPRPSILHGDLWGGNWISGEEGIPYLIDPSLLYGDHEFELAFTELFGGFSNQFYKAYRSTFPLSPEYEEKKELYQLYYLLVHLNMFGESYGPSVDRILTKYSKK